MKRTVVARRMGEIAPFRVMEILGAARLMEAQGRDIVHLEIGEPDFVSPPAVVEAGQRALAAGYTQYTPAAGLWPLREAIAAHYQNRFGIGVDPRRVLVTPGASGALQLVLGALLDPGDRVAVSDPGYPCNRHMVTLFGGVPVGLPVDQATGYRLPVRAVRELAASGLRALMIASPANPTGNVVPLSELRDLLAALPRDAGSVLICDEIYQGLEYEHASQTALALDSDRIVVINSFSKFFGMTGWRVGWAVAPEWLVEPMERLAQNLFLATPTVAQHAAMAAFSAANLATLEQRRVVFRERRDFLHAALASLGFGVGERPAGAFYVYADAARFTDDSLSFTRALLQNTGVAVTPGVDFGAHRAADHVRFAYTTSIERIDQGVERIREFLRGRA